MIRAGVRTDTMIGVTKFRIRKPKKFRLYYFWPTIQFLSMANTFSCLNIHCVFSTKERVWILIFENAFGLTWAVSLSRME